MNGIDADDIHELDTTTIERIAAGEVVERPASAVKELIENALDADATRITVELESGGVDRIRVVDDGIGMSESAARKAVRQHTTSKITDADDLDAGVGTLGFRGEALNTVGAVSRMTITTKPRGTDGAGTALHYEGGEVVSVEPAGCPEGTAIEVRELFYNTPARRKYLGREATEFAHANRVATRYALANPDVAVSLEHNGRETFSTTGRGNLQETILAVYGREVATAMRPIDEDALPSGPLSGLTGFVSDPETTRSAREHISTYVNGRYVSDGTLRQAVLDAYGDQLSSDRYPFAVLFLSIPPGEVDVNVHPRKMEVRFEDADSVYGQMRATIRKTLLSEGLIRTSAPRGRSAPRQTEITPETPSDEGEGSASPSGSERSSEDTVSGTAVETEAGTGAESPSERSTEAEPDQMAKSSSDQMAKSSSDQTVEPSPDTTTKTASSHSADSASGNDSTVETASSRTAITAPTEQGTLSGETVEAPSFDQLPSMRILGQLANTYLVAETEQGLVLIDQHAADERIHYERLREAFEGTTDSQVLAEPVTLSLTAGEAAVFEDHQPALKQLGFRTSRVDERQVEVRSVPSVFDDTLDPDLLRDTLSSLTSATDDSRDNPVEAAATDLLADMACHPAVTGNTSLAEGSVVALLSALDDCENPYACPHGRPVIVEIDGDEIAARFERDYPGHDGRRAE